MKKILLSAGLFISFATFASDKQVELKLFSAQTTNIKNVLTRLETQACQALDQDLKLQSVIEPKDVKDIAGQAQALTDLLANNSATKMFMEDLNAVIPANEKLMKQIPEFIQACNSIPEAQKFLKDFIKITAVMQLKSQMMGVQSNNSPSAFDISAMMQAQQLAQERAAMKKEQDDFRKEMLDMIAALKKDKDAPKQP